MQRKTFSFKCQNYPYFPEQNAPFELDANNLKTSNKICGECAAWKREHNTDNIFNEFYTSLL